MLSCLEDELNELILCSICIELLNDTRVLGCGHTFCLKCIQRYGSKKCPGDNLPCPMCRTEFEIPSGGFSDLSRNFLVEKILEIHASSLEALDLVNLADGDQKEDSRNLDLQQDQPDATTESNFQRFLETAGATIEYHRTTADDNSQPQDHYDQDHQNSTIVNQSLRQRQTTEQLLHQEQQQQETQQPNGQQRQILEQQQQHQQQYHEQQEQLQQLQRRRQQQHQQRHQRQLRLQRQQQAQRQQEQQEQRWQFIRNRRRLSAFSCGNWSKRLIVISMAFNFVLAASLWHTTELIKENEANWTSRSTDYEKKINELIEEDTKNKEIINSNNLTCEKRVFLTVQQCKQDLAFHQAFLKTVTNLLETHTAPKDPAFVIT